MNAQEQQMIQSLADRINGTSLVEKDGDAEQFLQQALGRNPDALYILAQTTLVQQYALEQAQKQLAAARAELEQQRQQAEQPKHATSFLGNLLGHHDDPAPPPPRQNYPPPYAPVPSYAPYPAGGSSFSGPGSGPGYVAAPPPPPPAYGQPMYGQSQLGQGQSGGFLRSAMQTAAGVAAGALAFEGIESLMHGFGGGGGSNFGSGMGGGRPEEIINNNYYGDATPGEHRDHLSGDLSPDIEDRRGESSAFGDAADRGDHNYGKDDLLDTSGTDDLAAGGDDATFDDSSADDSSMDDTNFDDGGGMDSSSFDDGN